MEKKEIDAVALARLDKFLADRRAEETPEDAERGLTRYTRLGVISDTMPALWKHLVKELEKEDTQI